jgi:hypothetical protein
MPVNRFVVFQVEGEWLVTCGDRTQVSFKSRVEAEASAFTAADALASNGHAVSVLIMPDGPAADAQGYAVLSGHTPQNRRN